MHKNDRDGKQKNGLKVTSNPWTYDHKMQSGQVVKSKHHTEKPWQYIHIPEEKRKKKNQPTKNTLDDKVLKDIRKWSNKNSRKKGEKKKAYEVNKDNRSNRTEHWPH